MSFGPLFEKFRKISEEQGNLPEEVIADVYQNILRRDPAVSAIDGGANMGYHTFPLASLPNMVKVYAVEANPDTYAKLAKKVQDIDKAGKVILTYAALQDDSARESVSFMASTSHPWRSGVNSIWQDDASVVFAQTMDVPATTIDALALDCSHRIGFIKLDLEGGEFSALRGGVKTLRTHRPFIVFESSLRAPGLYGYTIEDVFAFFADNHYKIITFYGDPATPKTYFSYWYSWACPVEAADHLIDAVQAAFLRSASAL